MRKPLEIVLQSLQHERPERLPVIPLVGLCSSTISGYSVVELLKDSHKQARSQIAALRRFVYDGVFTCMDLTAEAEALGAHTLIQNKAFPYVTKHPYREPDALSELELPPIKTSRLSVFVEATRELVQEVGRTHLVSSYVVGPFTLAGQLMGAEALLELTAEHPEQAAFACERCEQILEPYVEELIEQGPHNIVILEPTASSSVISPQAFAKFSSPSLKKLVTLIRSKAARATLHICGKTTKIIDAMCDTGADALSLDAVVSLDVAYGMIRSRCTLIGNVDTTTMMTGSMQDVASAAEKCINSVGGVVAGYILSTGCDLPIETPPDNVRTLVETGKKKAGSR